MSEELTDERLNELIAIYDGVAATMTGPSASLAFEFSHLAAIELRQCRAKLAGALSPGVTLSADERATLGEIQLYFEGVEWVEWNDKAIAILDRLIGGGK